jgi:hypothetical protein
MAFVIESSTVTSFAEYQDVVDRDQRLFQANEGLTDDVVDPLLVRTTERILTKLRASDWWRSYYLDQSNSPIYTVADIPALNPNKIKARASDFTDLCVYWALMEYILPNIADFGNENNEERQKMGYYSNKADKLFGELITAGDWYDFDGDLTVESSEKQPGFYNLKRVR